MKKIYIIYYTYMAVIFKFLPRKYARGCARETIIYLVLLCELAFLKEKCGYGEWQKLKLVVIQLN